MNFGYTLHMSFWSRVKVFFGLGVRVEVDVSPANDFNISVYVPGEEKSLKTILKLSL